MSDALQTILADPELQNWPNSAAAGIPAPPAEELPLAEISPPRSTPPPTAPEEPLLAPTAEPAADPDDTPTAADRDDGYDQPPGNSAEAAQETDIAVEETAAPTSLSAPPASAPTGSGLNPASSSPGAANPTAFGVSRIEIIGRRLS